MNKINENEFIQHGPKKVCNSCYDCNHTLFNQIDKNYLKLSNYLNKDDFNYAEKLSSSLTKNEIKKYKLSGSFFKIKVRRII